MGLRRHRRSLLVVLVADVVVVVDVDVDVAALPSSRRVQEHVVNVQDPGPPSEAHLNLVLRRNSGVQNENLKTRSATPALHSFNVAWRSDGRGHKAGS